MDSSFDTQPGLAAQPAFDTQPAPDRLFRVGRKPDPWAWTDLKYAGQGRWDDPERRYAVLYASGDAFGAYLESLSQFQPDLESRCSAGEDQEERGRSETHDRPRAGSGELAQPAAARRGRARRGERAVRSRRQGRHSRGSTSRTCFRARELEIESIDAGVIRLDYSAKFRAFTQAVSRFIYEQPEAYAGIFYLGQHGDEVENYAIFRRGADQGADRGADRPVTGRRQSEIALEDEDFVRACRLLGIEPA